MLVLAVCRRFEDCKALGECKIYIYIILGKYIHLDSNTFSAFSELSLKFKKSLGLSLRISYFKIDILT